MKLNTFARLAIFQLVPTAGNIDTMRLSQLIKKRLVLSEEEKAAVKLKEKDGMIQWDATLDEAKDFPFTEDERNFVASALRALSAAGELSIEFIGLWDCFVGDTIAPTPTLAIVPRGG